MAGPRPDTWMPMFWGDYVRDTGHLSAAHHGAYLMLIKHYWCTGAALPDDDDQLWRIACCDSIGHWKKLRPLIVPFFKLRDGTWWHKRVAEEMEKAAANVEKRAKAGKKGADKRWQTDGNANGKGMANASDSQWQNDGTPPSPSPEDSVADATGATAPMTDREWLWKDGLDLLAKHSGKPGSSLRSVVGRWLRDTGDNAAQLRAEIEAATGPPNPVAEPIAWITARLKPKAPHGQSEQLRRRTAQFAGLAAAAESLAAGEDVGPGVAALPKPGTPGRGVEIAESGLPEGPVRLSVAGGRAGH